MWRKEHLQQITATRICKYFHTHNYLCRVSSTQLLLRGETKIFVKCSYSAQRTHIYSCRRRMIPCFLGLLPTASLSQTSARITRDARLFLPVPLLCHWFRLRSSLSTAMPNPSQSWQVSPPSSRGSSGDRELGRVTPSSRAISFQRLPSRSKDLLPLRSEATV